MTKKITLTYFSDILCIWAYISQARLDEVARNFSEQIDIDYKFCSVFGDTAHKIDLGWADKGGYIGFARHVQEVAATFDHVKVHSNVWKQTRPTSSTPAHLVLKAVQRVDKDKCEKLLKQIRTTFFESAEDVSRWSVLSKIVEQAEISIGQVRDMIDSGVAYADLEADRREQAALMVSGSPTIILNNGRQKLYGNVGYKIIEANINELLRSKASGAASWC